MLPAWVGRHSDDATFRTPVAARRRGRASTC